MSNLTDDRYTKWVKRALPIGVASALGKRLAQEDMFAIGGVQPDPERMGLNGYAFNLEACIGVFDGHGGDRASRYCARKFHPAIEANLLNGQDVVEAIKNAVYTIDRTLCKRAKHIYRSPSDATFLSSMERTNASITGSTCLIAIIRDRILYVSNVGDSRAILCRAKGKSYIQMSRDHKPNCRDEHARLKANGATIKGGPQFLRKLWLFGLMIDVPRVNGSLAMSRSMGDAALKAFITCEPEIKEHAITDDDKYLILATDGLWDYISNRNATKIVSKCRTAQEAADALMSSVMDKLPHDNVTIIVLDVSRY